MGQKLCCTTPNKRRSPRRHRSASPRTQRTRGGEIVSEPELHQGHCEELEDGSGFLRMETSTGELVRKECCLVEQWRASVAGTLGFEDSPVVCTYPLYHCSLRWVGFRLCRWQLSVVHDRQKKCLVFVRYHLDVRGAVHHTSTPVPYHQHPEVLARIEDSAMNVIHIDDTAYCYQDHMVVIGIFRLPPMIITFVCVDLKEKSIVSCFDAPEQYNIDVRYKSVISPDKTKIGVLYEKHDSWKLYLYSVGTSQKLNIIELFDWTGAPIYNLWMGPGTLAFDPRYGWSRLAFCRGTHLAFWDLKSHQRLHQITVSNARDAFEYGLPMYSPDGRFLVVVYILVITEDRFSVTKVDIFDSDNLIRLATSSQDCVINGLHVCSCLPMFSACSQRLAVVSSDVRHSNSYCKMCVFELPQPINLQEICRMVIIRSVRHKKSLLKKLPLPPTILGFLTFQPMLE
ncbi:uncharacterized protein LOC106155409 [Lingula anatina]|uniref:Uncharacterized protein LOC106155409 n=1 Tax=Lingula anatina TaxID=7574 RepID=A0A1S3HL09_LINAN|nr:uncharacterized protein LOC106155409 [Lingula anatina]|eukprot:XP_013385694.1 uncharacterized protein LOC106155409 [Lingula anatina]